MILRTFSMRAALAATAITLSLLSPANAAVVYSYQGTSSQAFVDTGSQQVSVLRYLVKWSATFPTFVTSADTMGQTSLFETCSITPISASTFPVTKTCGTDVKLVSEASRDFIALSFRFPDFGREGFDPLSFAPGSFAKVGIYNAVPANFLVDGKLTIALAGVAPIPLPAAMPLLLGALAALGIAGRRMTKRKV